MVSCCCWELYCWWLGRPLVYLGMAYTKPQRHRLTIHQHMQQQVTNIYTTKAPEYYPTTCDALSYYTEAWSITLPQAASPKSRSTTPRFPSITPLRHRNTSRLRMLLLPTTPRVLINTIPKYYTTIYAAPSYYADVPKYYSALKEWS